jgi:hypothetical protein
MATFQNLKFDPEDGNSTCTRLLGVTSREALIFTDTVVRNSELW